MRKFTSRFANARNLDHIHKELIKIFTEYKKTNGKYIGYVAGIVTSDGEKHIERNLKILKKHRVRIQKELDFLVFSQPDIITMKHFEFMEEEKLPIEKREKVIVDFWCKIINSGFITDVFMTPRWELSNGATKEHNAALKKGLRIHYVE